MSATTTLTPGGQNNLSGDELALFLKIFSGEVMTQFERATVTKDKHRTRTIQSGKSAQFPIFGAGGTAYYTAGQNILDPANNLQTQIPVSEAVINVDKPLISSTNIAEIDQLHAHYDLRAPLSMEIGRALAYQLDKDILQLGVLAARANTIVQGGNGGSVIVDADAKTDAASLAASIFAAAQALDEKDVPAEGRFCFLRPAQYYTLVQNTDVINRDWGGAGIYSEGKVWRIAGITIVMTNHLPITDISAPSTGPRNTYHGDFSNTAALVMHTDAVGTVFLQDIKTEAEWKIEYQSNVLLGKYVKGSGILRPECAVEITQVAV